MKAGVRLGYLDDLHLVYRVHGDNASSAAVGMSAEKRLRVFSAAMRGYEALAGEVELSAAERRALRERLANDSFWKIGYAIHWLGGRASDAWPAFHRGLRHRPADPRLWKVYLACRIKALLGRAPAPAKTPGVTSSLPTSGSPPRRP
jgi:hypothetical protein